MESGTNKQRLSASVQSSDRVKMILALFVKNNLGYLFSDKIKALMD